MKKILFGWFVITCLSACVSQTSKEAPSQGHLRAEATTETVSDIPQPVFHTVALPPPKTQKKTNTYSVVVHKIDVHDLLFALARETKMNIDVHPEVQGEVTLNAIDQTLPQLLARIAKQVDMRMEFEQDTVIIVPDKPYLKTYQIDYVNMSREISGVVATNVQISTSGIANNITSSSSEGANASRIEIKNKADNHFWISLENNIKDILYETDKFIPGRESFYKKPAAERATTTQRKQTAKERQLSEDFYSDTGAIKEEHTDMTREKPHAFTQGRFREAASVIVNRESGVISVRATARQHEKIQEFLDRVMGNARRQVLIEATIVELQLSDGYQQGIDWSRLKNNTALSIAQPVLGTSAANSVTPFIIKHSREAGALNLDSTLNLLESFGTVKVLSSPKLSVMNNQTATIKVSEEFVYFLVKADIAAGNINTDAVTAVTTTPQSVSVGFFMSVTPQISHGGTVTLNIRPSISTISDLKQDPNPNIPANIKNYVPQIRTREIESIMRVESGDIAVLGGLMEDQMNNSVGRLPALGAVPILGEVFNNRSNTAKKSELIIFLRPTIIEDASLSGDFKHLNYALPDRSFFNQHPVFVPFNATVNINPELSRTKP